MSAEHPENPLDTVWQFAASGFLVGTLAFKFKPIEVFSSLLPITDCDDCFVRIVFEVNLN